MNQSAGDRLAMRGAVIVAPFEGQTPSVAAQIARFAQHAELTSKPRAPIVVYEEQPAVTHGEPMRPSHLSTAGRRQVRTSRLGFHCSSIVQRGEVFACFSPPPLTLGAPQLVKR